MHSSNGWSWTSATELKIECFLYPEKSSCPFSWQITPLTIAGNHDCLCCHSQFVFSRISWFWDIFMLLCIPIIFSEDIFRKKTQHVAHSNRLTMKRAQSLMKCTQGSKPRDNGKSSQVQRASLSIYKTKLVITSSLPACQHNYG